MEKQLKGTVFDIQRYSIHDGPGIRTLVFMKGCPLRCKWCSNPKGLTTGKSIMFMARSCYGAEPACRPAKDRRSHDGGGDLLGPEAVRQLSGLRVRL